MVQLGREWGGEGESVSIPVRVVDLLSELFEDGFLVGV